MAALGYAGFLLGVSLVVLAALLLGYGALVAETPVGIFLLVAGSLLLTLGGFQALDLLWVRLEQPPGRRLRRREAPELFATLQQLRRSLRSKRLNQVLLTTEFNASIVERPRLGVFGLSSNSLYLGLPLLEASAREEFEAVLAHEIAHLSARHGRFSAWIHRLRRSWERVFERLHQPPKSPWGQLVRRGLLGFIDWYWPRFNAWAFVLSRSNEYTADHVAGQWAGEEALARALWRLECQGQHMEEFFEEIGQLANHQAEPPADFMARLLRHLQQPPSEADGVRWMERAARQLTDNLDTHPSLSDRLQALGRSVVACRATGFPAPAHPSAAQVFLGDRLETLSQELSRLWQKEVRESWQKRHDRAVSLQRQLATLEQTPRDPESDPDLLWDKIRTLLALEGAAQAVPDLRRLLALRPDHAAANLALGQHLLKQGEPEGETLLQQVLRMDDNEWTPTACEILAQHFQAAGRREQVEDVHHRLSRYQAALTAAHRERNMVTAADRFLPHELSAEELAALQQTLAQHADVAAAWLVRKELKHFPGQRLYVLCVRAVGSRWAWFRTEADAALVARLMPQIHLPGRVLLIAPQEHFRALGRRVMRSFDAQVYPATVTCPAGTALRPPA